MAKTKNKLLLVKTLSERMNKDGEHYTDYYLVSKQSDSVKLTRVNCWFYIDLKRFDALAIEVKSLDEAKALV